METITKKINVFLEALQTLENALKIFYEYKALYTAHPTEKNKELFSMVRDATIQRFEYCSDLLWKVLKVYLEEVEKVDIANLAPRGIVREGMHIKLLSETESSECMSIIDSRNKTSHIYHQEMAEDIAQKIPNYYSLMKTIIDRIETRTTK